jgi:hypothetical protein
MACGARLDWGRFGGLLGHAGFIYTFCDETGLFHRGRGERFFALAAVDAVWRDNRPRAKNFSPLRGNGHAGFMRRGWRGSAINN